MLCMEVVMAFGIARMRVRIGVGIGVVMRTKRKMLLGVDTTLGIFDANWCGWI